MNRLPAEWEPHAATWMAWPHQKKDWPGRFQEIKWVFGLIAMHLTHHGEMVRIIVQNDDYETEAHRVLLKMGADLERISFHRIPTDRSWLRDTAPIFVKHGNGDLIMGLDFKFTAWQKYPNYRKDDQVARAVSKILKIPSERPIYSNAQVILEGGAIDSNGDGVLLTTMECLITGDTARRPEWTKEDWQVVFRNYLGIHRTIWLEDGIRGDDTGGHVDDLARFVDKDSVVAASVGDTNHPDWEALSVNLRILQSNGFDPILLRMPDPIIYNDVHLPASYVNFYIANKVVLVPVFDDVHDTRAVGILKEIFQPQRKVIPISCRSLVWGFGTIHCALMQEPLVDDIPF